MFRTPGIGAPRHPDGQAVSTVTALTLATCQVSRPRSAVPAMGLRRCGNRSSPRSRVVRIPQFQAAHPLGALPEVQVRHEQPGRPAVLSCQRLAVVGVSHPRLTAGQVRHRHVGRIAPVAVGHRERAVMPGQVQQRVHRHAPPRGIQLGPLRDAVNVNGHVLGRQGAEIRPAPRLLLAATADGEGPPVQGGIRCRAGGQDREVLGHVLARRDPARVLRRILAPTVESARNRAHDRHPPLRQPRQHPES
jgi:hypothetical protein